MIPRLIVAIAFLLGTLSTVSHVVVDTSVGPNLFASSTVLAQEKTISAGDYLPVKPNLFCRRNYSYTYGGFPGFVSEIVGSLTAPYTSGPITGALFCGFGIGSSDLTAFNTDNGVLRNIFDGNHYPSTDCAMSGFPATTLPESIYDGLLVSFSSVPSVAVRKDLLQCGTSGDADETLLFRIQDLQAGGRTYKDVVVLWFLQDGEPFVALDFHGKESDLGLLLPDATMTEDRRVQSFFALARHEGMIAGGAIEDDGALLALAELTSVDCSAGLEWDVFDVPGYYRTFARDINDNGDVVGYANKLDQTTRSFLRRRGAVTVFNPDTLAAANSWATGINNLGDIVGYFHDAGYQYHGYVLSNGVYAQIDAPVPYATIPFGINDRGDVVGTLYFGSGLPNYGFLRRDRVFHDIKVPEAYWTQALGVNNRGDVVGNFGHTSTDVHGFVLSAGVYARIDYPGAIDTQVSGINDDGEIAGGFREVSGGPLVAFARLTGEFLAIRGPCSLDNGNAFGINSKGRVSGSFVAGDDSIRWGFVVGHAKKGE